MSDDIEATEIAAQTMVFLSAAAVLSCGKSVAAEDTEALRQVMLEERTPPALVESVCQRCREGLGPDDVPVNKGLSQNQVALYSASIILFALRATSRGDPLEIAERLVSPYGVRTEFVAAFAREISTAPDARRTEDTAGSLRLLLEPPDHLVRTLRLYQGGERGEERERASVAHVSSHRIQHPDDREATESLSELSGLGDLVGFVMKHALEKAERVNNIGSKVRVSSTQFPGLYELFRKCVSRSGVVPEPELYLENGSINAYTYGHDRPYVVLHTGAITLLSTAELEFIIGHELGHVRFAHVLYLTLGRILPSLAAQLPFGPAISKGLELALYDWQRKAELSADRMGLLVSQDPDAALRVMVKLSGVPAALYGSVNVKAFLQQYEDFRALDRDLASAIAKVARTAYLDHPWTVVRAYELNRWVESGAFRSLTSAGADVTPERAVEQLPAASLLPFECPVCSSVVPADTSICRTCGSPCTQRNRFRRCLRCGSSCKPSLAFCENCGTRQQAPSEVVR